MIGLLCWRGCLFLTLQAFAWAAMGLGVAVQWDGAAGAEHLLAAGSHHRDRRGRKRICQGPGDSR